MRLTQLYLKEQIFSSLLDLSENIGWIQMVCDKGQGVLQNHRLSYCVSSVQRSKKQNPLRDRMKSLESGVQGSRMFENDDLSLGLIADTFRIQISNILLSNIHSRLLYKSTQHASSLARPKSPGFTQTYSQHTP